MLRAWAEQRATAAKGEGRTLETEGTFVGVEAVYKNTDKQGIFCGDPRGLFTGAPCKAGGRALVPSLAGAARAASVR